MIVTELETTPGDQEGYTTGEVVEFPETENQPSKKIFDSIQYYIEDDDETNQCTNTIIEELVSKDFEGETPKHLVIEEESSRDFNMLSFTRTFKTLVDIVTDPIIEECPSVSSTNSESSEESFSLLPILRTLSTKFIAKTSSMFKSEEPDLINLNTNTQNLESSLDSPEPSSKESEEEEPVSDFEVGGPGSEPELATKRSDEDKEEWKLKGLGRWF